MSDTTFANGTTLTDEDWFNDVNRLHYTIFNDPATQAAANTRMNGTLGTQQLTTSGTNIDFTGIPAGTKRIAIMFESVSTDGTSNWLIQLGDAGGIEASGYLGSCTVGGAATSGANFTTGFGIASSTSANVVHGIVELRLKQASSFTWVASGTLGLSSGAASFSLGGSKSLSAELTQLRITTVSGDAFDGGSINIWYQ